MMAGMNGVPANPRPVQRQRDEQCQGDARARYAKSQHQRDRRGTPFEWSPLNVLREGDSKWRRSCRRPRGALEAGGPLTSVTGPSIAARPAPCHAARDLHCFVGMTIRPPLPPFTQESAAQKVRLAEDGWNSRDPEKVAHDSERFLEREPVRAWAPSPDRGNSNRLQPIVLSVRLIPE